MSIVPARSPTPLRLDSLPVGIFHRRVPIFEVQDVLVHDPGLQLGLVLGRGRSHVRVPEQPLGQGVVGEGGDVRPDVEDGLGEAVAKDAVAESAVHALAREDELPQARLGVVVRVSRTRGNARMRGFVCGLLLARSAEERGHHHMGHRLIRGGLQPVGLGVFLGDRVGNCGDGALVARVHDPRARP